MFENVENKQNDAGNGPLMAHSFVPEITWSIMMSMTMKVPVRPMPAEQWTTIGP